MPNVPCLSTLTLTNANQAYPFTFPKECKRIEFYNRSVNDIKYAYLDGDIANGIYRTLPAGAEYNEEVWLMEAKTFYFQSEVAGDVLEIEVWTNEETL